MTRPTVEDALGAPVSLAIIAAAIALAIAPHVGLDTSALNLTASAFWLEPWRLATSALLHGDVLHLAFNLYWQWALGMRVERELGSFTMLGLVLVFAAGSGAAQYALSGPGVGLSGVGYGIFALLWVLGRYDARFADAMPASLARLFVIWFFFCIVTTHLGVMHVANVAHGAGAAFGALAGLALARRRSGAHGPLRVAGIAGTVLLLGASLAGATALRPYVIFSDDGGADSAVLGHTALTEGRYDDAVAHFRRAVEVSPDRASSWYNLGVTLSRLDRDAEALEAYQRANELEPDDAQYRDAVAGALAHAAYIAQGEGRDEEAAAAYRRSLALAPEHADRWFNLGVALQRSDPPGSASAFAKARELDPTIDRR
jgi:membrane associated rhomboid family serine protease